MNETMRAKSIEQFRKVTERVTRMLAQRHIPVTQVGAGAYVIYRPDGTIEKINIPAIPDTADDALFAATRGFVDHEVAHVLFTTPSQRPPVVFAGHKHLDLIHSFYNQIEDTRIERLMRQRFGGSDANLSWVFNFVAERSLVPVIKKARETGDTRMLFDAGLMPLLRAWAGDKAAIRFVEEQNLEVDLAAIIKRLAAIKSGIANVKTTRDAADMGKLIYDIVTEPPAPPPPPEPPPPEEKHEQKSDQSAGDSESPPEDGDKGSSDDGEEEKQGESDGDDAGEEEGEDGKGEEEPAEDEKGDADAGAGGEDEEEGDAGDGAGGEDEKEGDDEGGSGAGSSDKEEEGDEDEDGDKGAGGSAGEDGEEEEKEEEGNPSAGAGDEGDKEPGADEKGDGGSSESKKGDDDQKGDDKGDGGGEEGAEDLGDIVVDPDGKNDMMDMAESLANVISVMASDAMDTSSAYTPFTTDKDETDRVRVRAGYESDAERAAAKFVDRVKMQVGQIQARVRRMLAQQDFVANYGGFRSGKMQSSALHKLRVGDDRVFTRREEHHAEDTAFTLLIDNSGSMRGEKMRVATETAFLMAETLARLGINFEILGFTTALSLSSFSERDVAEFNRRAGDALRSRKVRAFSRVLPIQYFVYKAFEDRWDNKARSAVIGAGIANGRANLTNVKLGANIDGESVAWAAGRLAQTRERRKIMMVLSDGNPAGAPGHDDVAQLNGHLLNTVKRIEEKGIETIGIGILSDAVNRFYPNSVVVRRVEDLGGVVLTEIEKFLKGRKKR